MSFKSKNLTYEKNEPAFLRRLRGEYGEGTGPRQAKRPAKPRLADDDDDEPTYVDEESNEVISKEEYAALLNPDKHDREDGQGADAKKEGDTVGASNDNDTAKAEEPKIKQNIAEIGGAKKRKQAKVVGEDAPEERTEPTKKSTKAKHKKKIKLSFEDS